jgi:ubiquinone/menaquinone biosynthesis C-methylase UbiE
MMRQAHSRSTKRADFSEIAPRYANEIDNAIAFSGLKADFFTRAKALLLMEEAAAHFGPASRVRALDVGCGIASIHGELDPERFALTGVDVAEGALAQGRKRSSTTSFVCYDGRQLPFRDGEFDMSFTICVLHHISLRDRDRFLREMRRVTRKGGMLVIIEHNPYNPLTRLAVLRCPFDEDAVLLLSAEVRRRLAETGPCALRTRYFELLPFFNAAARWLERKTSGLPLGAQYSVVATV